MVMEYKKDEGKLRMCSSKNNSRVGLMISISNVVESAMRMSMQEAALTFVRLEEGAAASWNRPMIWGVFVVIDHFDFAIFVVGYDVGV